MGVPALFRWLSQKYPKIISPVIEEKPQEVDDGSIPVDTTKPNPNGEEMDNLYLDMNGIVHPCSHPEDKPPPANEEEMMLEVFKYTDRIVNMCRPRKVLMLAVDGVAPRAKMNQQRSRRFRAAQEAKENEEKKAEYLELLKEKRDGVLPVAMKDDMQKKAWDSNVITPGTPFMDTLSISLKYWIAYKLNTDPMWANLKIILSDASVPGEGEHKIMEFIRSQRQSPEHDPNIRHVICGLDADLIMLGLATHEPHFRVLREDVFFDSAKPRHCKICGQPGHYADQCRGEVKEKSGEFDEKAKVPTEKPWIWLHVAALREYLAIEMHVPNQPFRFDLERAIDDWVFMCFFVGNDFLPHLPSLDIRHEGIDTLIAIWRDNVNNTGGYITKDGFVDLGRVQHILSGLAKQEAAIFKRRREVEVAKEAKEAARDERKKRLKQADQNRRNERFSTLEDAQQVPGMQMYDFDAKTRWENLRDGNVGSAGGTAPSSSSITHDMVVNRSQSQDANVANKSAAAVLRERMQGQNGTGSVPTPENGSEINEATPANEEGDDSAETSRKRKRASDDAQDEEGGTPGRDSPKPHPESQPAPDAAPEDNVRLWEPGYEERYYEQKFHVAGDDHEFRHKVARAYVEGLAWVLLYYFQGCPSWTWYYPYHYAPFASDFVDLGSLNITFDKGVPFRPFEQLMGVLPAASNHAIPEVFRSLMTDDDSDIRDFYPEQFPVDMNGKKMAWLGIALLPFIDEKRLLNAMAEKYPLLSSEEKARNEMGHEILFFSDNHPLFDSVADAFYSKKQASQRLTLDPVLSQSLLGDVRKNEDYIPQSSLTYPLTNGVMPDLEDDHSISLQYDIPHSPNVHKSMLLRGAELPPKALTPDDEGAARANAFRTGRSFGGAPLRGDNNRGRGRGGRGNQINYGNHGQNAGGQYQNDSNGRPNPFGAHLDPSFFASGMPPPPGFPAPNGWSQSPAMGGNFPQGFGRGNGPAPPFPRNPPNQAPAGRGWHSMPAGHDPRAPQAQGNRGGYGGPPRGGYRGNNRGGYDGGHRGGNGYGGRGRGRGGY